MVEIIDESALCFFSRVLPVTALQRQRGRSVDSDAMLMYFNWLFIWYLIFILRILDRDDFE